MRWKPVWEDSGAARRIVALAAAGLALAGSLGGGAGVVMVVAALALAGVAVSGRPEGHALLAAAAGLAAVRTGSVLAGAGALLAAAGALLLVGTPSVGLYWRLRLLAVAGAASLYPISIYAGTLAAGRAENARALFLLGSPAGRGLLLVLLSLYTATVLWMALAPGRAYQPVRGVVRRARRRIDLLVAAPLLGLMLVAPLASPLSLVFSLLAAASYIWSRLLGAGRLGGILVAALVYGGLLVASGAASQVDDLLGRLTLP